MGEVAWPFSRVYDRVAMLVALALIIIYRKNFRLNEVFARFAEIKKNKRALHVFLGAFLTILTMGIAIPFVVGEGAFSWRGSTGGDFALRIFKALLSAVVVSIIEESFFRVLVLDRLRERLGVALAVIATSVFYSAVHFIKPDKSFSYEGFSLFAGFDYLGAVAKNLLLPGIPAAGFGLFLVGIVLAVAMIRSNSIYLCIGLHIGWVFGLKILYYLTITTPGFNFPEGVGRRFFLLTQPAAWVSILAALIVVYLVTRVKLFSSNMPQRLGQPC